MRQGQHLMLTHNFSEIISVVLDKSRHNALETLSSDEIRSISLMLLGYLRLIKSGFKTADDSQEPREGYYADLKGVLNLLTRSQNKLLQKMKQESIVDFNADLDSMVIKLKSINNLSVLDVRINHERTKHSIFLFKKSIDELKTAVEEQLLDNHVGFMDAIRVCFHDSTLVMELIKGIAKSDSTQAMSHLQDLFQETFTYHLKKWTKWVDIERTNQQCISYGLSSDYIDLV